MNYYNENDPRAAAWLRELIKHGHISGGVVDERSISDVRPEDLEDYVQCHFFAGIGGWSYALRLAGWPDDKPVWTGSCPCQPFSQAGKGGGIADERHLWPDFKWLISQCGPSTVFGEQVAGKAGREWFAGVRADMEELGYEVGGADLCAASVSAPHIRQRLYWMANTKDNGLARQPTTTESVGGAGTESSSGMGESNGSGWDAGKQTTKAARHGDTPESAGGGLDNPNTGRLGKSDDEIQTRGKPTLISSWSSYDLILCADGKSRRIESGTFPLAHGIPGRVGLLRGYGNAIVPQLAAQFIIAASEIISH